MADGLSSVNSIVLKCTSMHGIPMMHRVTLALFSVGLCACTPLTIYHREGVPVQRMQADLLDCQVDALSKAPVASQLRRGPPRYIPGSRHCYGSGRCYRYGGYYVPGEVYSVDVNASLRRQLENQCMARQGYQRVEVPNCPAGTPPPEGLEQTQTLPPLSENSCAIRGDAGEWLIVDVE